MRDTHHLRRLTPLALLATLALAACTGGDPAPSAPENEGATPTTEDPPTVEATPTATTEATPPPEVTRAPTPTPTPAPVTLIDGIPEGAVGPLLVYTSHVRQVNSDNRGWPTRAVITYDLGTEREVASFEVGSVGSHLSGVAIAGRELLVNLDHTLEVRALNGDLLRILREAPGDESGNPYGRLGGMTVSADGLLVAITEQAANENRDRGSLLILDVRTGEVIQTIGPDDARFVDLTVLWVAPHRWRDDGSGLLVAPVTSYEGTARFTTLSLDGSLAQHRQDGFGLPAPTGRRIALSSPLGLGCKGTSGHQILVADLDSDATLASFEDDTSTFFPARWSADATELLIQSRPFPSDPAEIARCEWRFSEPSWLVLDIEASEPPMPANPLEVIRRWDGDRAISFFCAGAERPGRRISGSGEIIRPDECSERDATPADILIAGTPIAAAGTPWILGWIDLP